MRLALAVGVSLVAAAAVGESRGIPRFEAHSQIVSISLTVTDKKGEFIDGLTSSDFVILEDAVRQEVAVLDHDAPPTDLVLMVDASGSMGSPTQKNSLLNTAKRSALQFIQALRPDDRVLVLSFTTITHGYSHPSGDLFTNDRAFLSQAIASIGTELGRDHTDTSLYTALYTVLRQDLGKTYRRTQDPDYPHRPVIVVLTDGLDNASLVTSDQVLELAHASGVAVYSILMPTPPSPTENWQSVHDALYFINRLAKETGGSVTQLTSMYELKRAYECIARELSTQYRIGYVPSAEKKDGAWHTIQIVVRGRPDLTVRHRKGYYAPKK